MTPVSIDTNVLIRYLLRDDERQASQARALFARAPVFVTTTVVMETEWVLRKTYGYGPTRIADAFSVLVATEGVRLDDSAKIETAITGLRKGLDFADALHLAGSAQIESFATFDGLLRKRAHRAFTAPRAVSP
ncbi:MAG: type II toxin-antitoxin system VapC family toxin [Beijerinckiaceae bacterium]